MCMKTCTSSSFWLSLSFEHHELWLIPSSKVWSIAHPYQKNWATESCPAPGLLLWSWAWPPLGAGNKQKISLGASVVSVFQVTSHLKELLLFLLDGVCSDDSQPSLQREACGISGSHDAAGWEAGCQLAHHQLHQEVRQHFILTPVFSIYISNPNCLWLHCGWCRRHILTCLFNEELINSL